MQKYQNNVQTLDGRAIVGASVTVTEFPGGAPATVYNSNGSGVITQPILTNGDGEFAFYAANGRYQLQVTGGGISVAQTITDIVLFDPSDGSPSSDITFIQTGVGAVQRTVQDKGREYISVKDFGATGNGVADDTTGVNAGSNEVSAKGGGTLNFPIGTWNFTFTKPPYGVVWQFNGPETNRQQLGGTNTSVRYIRPSLAYMPGPHATSQLHVDHVRAIAKGSNAIGAQFADYGSSVTIEKENWSETSGTPTAGEINGMSIFTRNGAVNGDPVKTGGAGILFDIGQTADSGYTQVIESVNSVFTKGTLAIEKQTNMQLLGIDERDNLSYGAIFNSLVGTQNSAIKTSGTTAAPWGRLIENLKDGINNFNLEDTGRQRWRTSGGTNVSMELDDASGDLVFRNNASSDIFRVGQTRTTAIANTPRTNTGTTDTIAESDHDRIVQEANAAAITVTLSATARAGVRVRVIQRDAGQVTFTPAAGATLRNRQSHTKTAGQFAVVTLEVGANTGSAAIWYLSGDTAA